MAISYVLYQDTRKGGSHLWYGRAVHHTTVDLEKIAERIQRNCSLKKSDVMGVLTEMVEVMNDEMQNSNKVKIDGLGTFYIGIRSSGTIDEKDYNPQDNIKGFRVNFLAEGKKYNGKMTRAFTYGLKVQKAVGANK